MKMTEHNTGTDEGTKLDATTLEGSLLARARALRDAIANLVQQGQKAQKALDALAKSNNLPVAADLEKAMRELRKANFEIIGFEEQRRTLIADLDGHEERRRTRVRMQFLGELQTLARAEEVEVIRLTDTPLTLQLAPFTVEIDFDKNWAHLTYAREIVEELSLSAQVILDSRKRAVEAFRQRAVDSAKFFDLLDQAYQFVLLTRSEPPGTRVDLVDLLVPLAVLSAQPQALRKQGVSALSEYPRYMLAYQLNRLRRDGVLEKNGRRIDLGTATGGSTKNKRDVLFIPSAGSEGQFYLSIRIGA
jgi:hypothetical protein